MNTNIYDFNYSSISTKLVECNNKLANCFKEIYLLYCEYQKRVGMEFNISFVDCFTDPALRYMIMTDGVNQLKNAGYDIDLLYENYCALDESVSNIQDIINHKLSSYEMACKNITNAITDSDISLDNSIDAYFECVIEAYNNYLMHGFEDKFSFKSTEMRQSSFHSIMKNGMREELNTTLSIPHNKVLHLMELPNPQSKNSFFADLYKYFCENHPKEIETIKNTISKNYNSDEVETRAFIVFINTYAIKFVKTILLDEDIVSDVDMTIVNKCRENYKREKILLEIKKSFEKCINFRKMYEYKMIPEIVLDYQINGGSIYKDSDNKEYRYRTTSSAFTPLGNNDSIALREILTLNSNKDDFILNPNIMMSDADKNIIKQILKKFNNDLDVRISWNNGKIKMSKDGFIALVADDFQYKYFVDTNDIKADDPVNTFLISYDENKMQLEEVVDRYCMMQVMIILGYHIAKYLHSCGITYSNEYDDIDVVSLFKESKNKIKNIMKNVNKYGYSNVSIASFYDDIREIGLNDGKLLNVELLVNYVNSLLKHCQFDSFKSDIEDTSYDDYINLIKAFIPDFDDEKLVKEKATNSLDKVINFGEKLDSQLISNDELDGLKRVIKSYFDSRLGIKHFREIFDIVGYDGINYVPKTYTISSTPNKDEIRIVDDIIPYSIIMKLSEGIKSVYESEFGLSRQYDTTGSLCGFYVERANDSKGTINNYYAKTFMGKTSLQISSDLRINGFPYKLDSVYGKKNNQIVFYSVMPLTKYNLDYTLHYNKDNGRRK